MHLCHMFYIRVPFRKWFREEGVGTVGCVCKAYMRGTNKMYSKQRDYRCICRRTRRDPEIPVPDRFTPVPLKLLLCHAYI